MDFAVAPIGQVAWMASVKRSIEWRAEKQNGQAA